MLNSWIALIVIWAIVELIGMALKINYSKRMKYGAIWSVVIVSLATVGQMRTDQSALLQFALCMALYGTVSAIIFYTRLKLAKLW